MFWRELRQSSSWNHNSWRTRKPVSLSFIFRGFLWPREGRKTGRQVADSESRLEYGFGVRKKRPVFKKRFCKIVICDIGPREPSTKPNQGWCIVPRRSTLPKTPLLETNFRLGNGFFSRKSPPYHTCCVYEVTLGLVIAFRSADRLLNWIAISALSAPAIKTLENRNRENGRGRKLGNWKTIINDDDVADGASRVFYMALVNGY